MGCHIDIPETEENNLDAHRCYAMARVDGSCGQRKGPGVPPGPSRSSSERLVQRLLLRLAVVIDVPSVVDLGQVALLVPAQIADHGRDRVAMKRLGNLFTLERFGDRGSSSPRLDRGVGVEGVSLRLIALGTEL